MTDPEQAVSLDPHLDPELEALRQDTVRALEITDKQAELRAMSRGELEGQVLDGERAQATAPLDVSSQLRLTWQADADAWQQAADAQAQHDQARADNARSLAAPWPPDRKPEAGHQEPVAAAPGSEPQRGYPLPGIAEIQTDPEPETSELETPGSEAVEPGPADDGRVTRLDELQARADKAARRIDAQRAELDAISEHSARIEREAQAEPEAGRQAETSYEMEL